MTASNEEFVSDINVDESSCEAIINRECEKITVHPTMKETW